MAYENAKRDAENKIRTEKDIMRKKQFESERKRKERMLSEVERVAKQEAAKDVASEYEQRNVRDVTETVDERNDDNDEGVFYTSESPVREGRLYCMWDLEYTIYIYTVYMYYVYIAEMQQLGLDHDLDRSRPIVLSD